MLMMMNDGVDDNDCEAYDVDKDEQLYISWWKPTGIQTGRISKCKSSSK